MRIILFISMLLLLIVMYLSAKWLLSHYEIPFRRIAYTVSAFWLGVPLLLMLATKRFQWSEVSEQALVAWVLLAVVPNALFWAVIWLLRSFRRD